jgi:hypothetical protein
MSYLRGQYYTYSDGDCINLPSKMPMAIFNALVMMQYYRMTKTEKKKAEKLAYQISGGNFGCDALAKKLGKMTAQDWLKREVKKQKND